tara:strand:+ start:5973 stop:6242 length:270 start_codon:yes stop_codon:yes gene_type:complete
LDIVKILKQRGKKYKKRVGHWYCFDFNAGFTLVYDSYLEYMGMESGHERYSEEGYFGDRIQIEAFIGEPNDVEVETDYLEKLKDRLKYE